MQDVAPVIDVNKLPRPFDAAAARDRLEDWTQDIAATLPALTALLAEDSADRLALSVFGNSPYLCALMRRDPALYIQFLRDGPDQALDDAIAAMTADLAGVSSQADLMKHLRIGKRAVALITALADIAGLWPLEKVTGALSGFAETATGYAIAYLLRERMRRGDLAPTGDLDAPLSPDLARNSGYIVLAMGKLGAGELNYSSDIDLIVLFDGEVVDYRGKRDPQDCFIRITRDLVKVMQERTGDGYVFRTDLRLRPDAGATPVVISVDAAEIYYQSMGLNWERSAMIKARPIAGDLDAGYDFLDRIKGFVWRRHLDYAALEDIHDIKNRIHDHKNHRDIQVAGQDVKLGPGGIREIEFFVQAHQLIYGGRNEALRVRQTLAGLDVLKDTGTLTPGTAATLARAYDYLRRLEHRLQMVNDEQTQQLPETPEGIAEIAVFMGYDDITAFEQDFVGHLVAVKAEYDRFFADAHAGEAPATERWSGLFASGAKPAALLDAIAELGFENPEAVVDTVRRWETGRFRALRTSRARNLLRGITPTILDAFAATAGPDRALSRFDDFLGRLPSGVQILSLFQANPALLTLLAEILGSAPALADFLSRNHLLLDSVLSPGFFAPLDGVDDLETALNTALHPAQDFQDVMDLSRRWANEQRFRVGVNLLRGLIDPAAAAEAHTAIAEAVIRALLPAVEKDFAIKHGRIPNSALAVVAMGSFGGRDISFTSDLDMIFIYDKVTPDQMSDGEKPLPAPAYYGRLSQRLINGLTALTGEGRLFEVDMRLRPSGNAGPIAVSVAGFETYQHKDAWTWEHMALTRARPIAGPADLQTRIAEAVRNILVTPRDNGEVARAVADMRARMAKEFATDDPWSVKQVRGGLVDLEFIAQYLQLAKAAQHPDILSTNTIKALERAQAAGLLTAPEADALLDAARLLGAVRGFARQCLGGDFDPAIHTARAVRTRLARAAGTETFDMLARTLPDIEHRVKSVFDHLIPAPDADMQKENKNG